MARVCRSSLQAVTRAARRNLKTSLRGRTARRARQRSPGQQELEAGHSVSVSHEDVYGALLAVADGGDIPDGEMNASISTDAGRRLLGPRWVTRGSGTTRVGAPVVRSR